MTLDSAVTSVPDVKPLRSAGNPLHSSALSVRRWYCVGLLSNLERTARSGLNDLGLETWFPRTAMRLPGFAYQDPRGWKIQPLWPGYGLVRFDALVDPWQRINSVNGVYRLFRHGPEKPTPLPDDEIEKLRSQANIHEVIYPAPPAPIEIGQSGKITSGPLAGLEGMCDQKEGGRVRLLLSLLGRATQIEFAAQDVETVNA